MTTRAGNVVRELLRLGMTQAQIGADCGVDQSTVNRWNRGSEPKGKNLRALQRLGRIKGLPAKLLVDLEQTETALEMHSMPLLGYVGAGAVVIKVAADSASDYVETVDVPIGFGNGQAVKVRGDSMYPAYYDGDVLCVQAYEGDIDDVLGKDCLVITADDQWLVKRIERGSRPGRYHLVSHNAPVMPDVELRQVSPVRLVIKR